jgi:ribosomal protein S18 acetylase RimI-like enzyme
MKTTGIAVTMEAIKVRRYTPEDYSSIVALYKETEMPGSEFDLNRDSEQRLQKRIENDPDAILIGEVSGEVVGSVSLIEDGRVAWLFRFRVREIEGEEDIAKKLLDAAVKTLNNKGHGQILVYTPVGETKFQQRYKDLGFNQGHDYTCFWKDI